MEDTLLFTKKYPILTIHSSDGYNLYYPKDELIDFCKYLNDTALEMEDLDEINIPFVAKKIDSFLRFFKLFTIRDYSDDGKFDDKDVLLLFGKSQPNGLDILTFLIEVSEISDYLDCVRLNNRGWTLEEIICGGFYVDIDVFEECPENNKLNVSQWRYLFVSAKWYLDHLIETNDEYLRMCPDDAKKAYYKKHSFLDFSEIV